MKTKTLRLPADLTRAVGLVEKNEKIEEASAMRKLMRIGFESYLGQQYKNGHITLREAAQRLDLSLSETEDLFREGGVSGNVRTDDVMVSLTRFLP